MSSSGLDGAAGHDHRVDRLAPALVGDPEDRGLQHERVGVEGLLDLGAVHVLAAGDDHVLRAVEQEQVAVVVEAAHVAGPVPAVAQHRRGLLRLVPVAGHDVRALHGHLTGLTVGQRSAVGAADHDLDAHHRLTGRAAPVAVDEPLLVAEAGHQRRRLGGAVEVHELGGRERLGRPPDHLRGDRRPTVGERAQRLDPAGPVELLLDHRRHHRGHPQRGGHALGLDRVEGPAGLEGGEDHLAGAHVDRLQQRDRAGRVEQRRHHQVDVRLVHRGQHLGVERVGQQVAVGQHDALRRPRRPAGVEEAGEVVLAR